MPASSPARRLIAAACAVLLAPLVAAAPATATAAAPTITNVRPATGPTTGGTKVQIVGANYTGVQSVRFGSTSAPFTVARDHGSLVATAPAASTTGAVTLTLTTSSGTTSRSAGFRYTDPWAAHSYTAPQVIDAPVDSPAVLSCPASHCYGMDDYSNFLDSGTGNGTWINRHHPFGDGSATKPCTADDTCASLSCPAVDYCVSVDDAGEPIIWTGGLGWKSYASLNPAGGHTFDHTPFVSCASTTFCVVFDTRGDYSVWNGTVWSPVTTVDGVPVATTADESTFGMSNVSCAGSECMMTNGAKARHYVSGAWTAPVALGDLSFGQNNLSCANVAQTGTSLLCIAGYADGESVYSHGAWRGPQHRFGTFGISCRTDARCLVMDDHEGAHVYDDAKASSSTHGFSGPFPIPTDHQLGFLNASACKAGLNCLASITNGYAATFNISTHKWTMPGSILAPSLGISGIGCSNHTNGAALCLAGDVGPWLTTGSGSTWQKPVKTFGPGEQTVAVSCVDHQPYFCMALANNNRYTTKSNHYATLSGNRLQEHSMLTGTYKSLACWSATGCYAVSDTKVLRWNGSDWTVAVDLAKRHLHFVAITCLPGKPGCLALARNNSAYWINGSKVSAPFTMKNQGLPSAVACQDAQHCVATSNGTDVCTDCGGGTFYSDSNRHWVIQGSRSGYRPNLAVSCAPSSTTARCLAVGYGASTTWDGAVGYIQRSKLPAQTAVTCSTVVCVVGDTKGQIQRY